jgi:peptidoglycan lytic transglycosylase G
MGELGELGFGAQRRVRHKHGRSLLVVVIALGVILGGGYLVFKQGTGYLNGKLKADDYEGGGQGSVQVTIPDGATLTQMADVLTAADVVKSPDAFRSAARQEPEATSIRPGLYQLKRQMSGEAALAALLDPTSKVVNRLTIPEGWTARQIFAAWSKKTGIARADFEAASKDRKAIGLPAYAKGVEGYLYPATYDVPAKPTATDIEKMMVDRYLMEAKKIGVTEVSARLGLKDPSEFVTLASIVQKEVNRNEDMPMVSQVVLNRLAKKKKLQFDSTLKYLYPSDTSLLLRPGQIKNRSPYNTYIHGGLPPGPISNPGANALEAAAKPAPGNWLYFITVNPDTGETRFTASDKQWAAWRKQLLNGWCKQHAGKC